MTEIELFQFMQGNRQIFSTYYLTGTIMPIGVIFAAYMFRGFDAPVRYAAMGSALIGVIMLFVFINGTQTVFYGQLTTLSQLAASGSDVAKSALTTFGMPIGQTISPPIWMVALSLIQILINLVLTVYLFAFAKWEKN